MSRVFCIAEAGSSHDGDLAKAYRLIEVARAAGADAVKFQAFHAETLAARRNAPNYLAVYQRYEMPLAWLPDLSEAAAAVGLAFIVATYHADYLPLVVPWVDMLKIASFEAQDAAFLDAHAETEKPVIVSTGMMPRAAIRGIALRPFVDTVLHCVSAYPVPLAQASIAALRDLPLPAAVRRGYSDHSHHELAGALAVAAGAQVVETHICLETTEAANPDRVVSHEPEAFGRYVASLRIAEQMVGTGGKAVQECESDMEKYLVRT